MSIPAAFFRFNPLLSFIICGRDLRVEYLNLLQDFAQFAARKFQVKVDFSAFLPG
jgi:hypothetical protein